MFFTIGIINAYDDEVDLALRDLIKAAFKSSPLLPPLHLAKNIESNASQPSFFLAAKEGTTIIGCNAFLANDFTLNGKSYVGYQSCWSATDPAHQGKGVFVSIINEAKKILKEKKAGFLYGIANDNSHPIFTKKLGFKEIPVLITRIPNIPFVQNYYLSRALINKNDACRVDEKQVMDHKILQSPTAIRSIEYQNSWIWGKLSTKQKAGLTFSVFEIGGLHIVTEAHLKKLIKKAFLTLNVSFIQVVSCATNTINPLFRRWKSSVMNGFIFYNLNMPEFEHFNVMNGVLDVF